MLEPGARSLSGAAELFLLGGTYRVLAAVTYLKA